MSKDKITDYDTTASGNEDVGGVNIQGTAPSSNMDNGLREIMSHLAEANAGTNPVADTWSFADPSALTKIGRFDMGGITAGQTRVLTFPDWDFAADSTHWTMNGRLTLTTATAITAPDVTGAGTVYYTPFRGNRVWLYNGTIWKPYALTEVSVALSGGTASKPHDLFLYDNSGTLTLDLVAWTDDTNRATALTLQDGVYVKSGAATRRYLGTIYLDGSKQCEDSAARRMLWNYYNRVPRSMLVKEAVDEWTYTTATYRQARGNSANQLEFVRGLDEDMVEAEVLCAAETNTGAGVSFAVAIGLDSTSAKATDCVNTILTGASNGYFLPPQAQYRGMPGIGRHRLVWLEWSTATATTTWYGDAGGSIHQSGIFGEVMA